MHQVPFFQHDLGRAELASLAEVLDGPLLTTGDSVARFEQRFADYLGRRHALGVMSCTGALHLALLALGVGAGDEVITTPLTFVATAQAVLAAGAVPVFADVEPETGNLDAARVEAAITPRTRAVLPVHLYGQMCDMRALRRLAERHGLHLIEDAAHAIEAERDGVRPGQLGNAACFSFHATKSITCGEGGAVVTDDDALAGKLRLLSLHGMTRTGADRYREGYKHWDVVLPGWKCNMSDIQAALLLPQLDRLHENWRKRVALAGRYRAWLSAAPGLSWPRHLPGIGHAFHLFPVWIDGGRRDVVVEELQQRGIATAVHYRPVHLLSYFRERFGFRPGDFPHAERIGERTLSLPFYATLPAGHVERVADALHEALRTRSRAAA